MGIAVRSRALASWANSADSSWCRRCRSVAVQLAKLQGAEVCTTVSSEEKANFVKQLGADSVILYKNTDVVDEVLTWTQGQGVDLAFDTVGEKLFTKLFRR